MISYPIGWPGWMYLMAVGIPIRVRIRILVSDTRIMGFILDEERCCIEAGFSYADTNDEQGIKETLAKRLSEIISDRYGIEGRIVLCVYTYYMKAEEKNTISGIRL